MVIGSRPEPPTLLVSTCSLDENICGTQKINVLKLLNESEMIPAPLTS